MRTAIHLSLTSAKYSKRHFQANDAEGWTRGQVGLVAELTSPMAPKG